MHRLGRQFVRVAEGRTEGEAALLGRPIIDAARGSLGDLEIAGQGDDPILHDRYYRSAMSKITMRT